jgi:hypothetical protein
MVSLFLSFLQFSFQKPLFSFFFFNADEARKASKYLNPPSHGHGHDDAHHADAGAHGKESH